MMGFGFLFLVLIVGLIVYAIGWKPQFQNQVVRQEYNPKPYEILKERYARGEISREEFQELRSDLGTK